MLSMKNEFRSPVLVSFLGLTAIAGGVLLWQLASKTAPTDGMRPAMLTAQGGSSE